MHNNSKFNTWDSFKLFQISERGKSSEIVELVILIAKEIALKLKLGDDSFALSKTMLTYYGKNDKVFGNIRINKNSIRVEPLFSNIVEEPHKLQADGYDVHSIKISNKDDYDRSKDRIFKLLNAAFLAY